VANVGNFAYRSLVLLDRGYGRTVPEPGNLGEAEAALSEARSKAVRGCSQHIESGSYDRALKVILEYSTSCNQYLQTKAPWEKREDSKTAIYCSANAVAALSLLLEPFLPFTSAALWKQLAIERPLASLSWEEAEKDLLKPGHKIAEPRPLFKKVEGSDLESLQKFLEQKK